MKRPTAITVGRTDDGARAAVRAPQAFDVAEAGSVQEATDDFADKVDGDEEPPRLAFAHAIEELGEARPFRFEAPLERSRAHVEEGGDVVGRDDSGEPLLDSPDHAFGERARAWRRRLDTERGLNQLKLAAEEGLSPGSITHHLKLLQLADDIQAKLLDLTKVADVRRYGLNRMKALADRPHEEQRREFAAMA